ncbi:hypothetical protein BC943DRAFT_353222 [Umbelopsis sp. AD052]|nr:hypothetical protein BC943DRAFT_353222 [Umbelopsis sp. AD052]
MENGPELMDIPAPNPMDSTTNEIMEDEHIDAEVQALRTKAEDIRKRDLQDLAAQRLEMLKQLFLMTENQEHHIEYIENFDVSADNIAKLNEYLDEHKLRPTSFESILQELDNASDISNADLLSPTYLDDPKSDKRLAKRVLPPPERMVTRGVSGAIRHRSVDEILSAAEKSIGVYPSSDYMSSDNGKIPIISLSGEKSVAKRTKTPASRKSDLYNPYPIQTYNGIKLPNQSTNQGNGLELYAYHLKVNAQPLYKSLQTARKVLMTQDWKVGRDELKASRAIQKIEESKQNGLWSMKQHKRHRAVARTKTHWDSLIDEMKWMRTDFKEERKWKIATAYMISRAVMEWHWADDKQSVCVKARPHIPIDERQVLESMETDEPKIEGSADVTLLEALKTEDLTDKGDSLLAVKESDTPTTTSAMPPPPSPNLWNEFKTSILNLDIDNPIFVLPIDTLVDMDLTTLFPELPLYEAPQPNDADAYIDELEYGRVVPITKFISQKTVIKKKLPPTRKRTAEEAFMQMELDQEEVPQLPKHDKYDTAQYLSPLFALRKVKDTPATQPPTPQPPNPAINRHPATWSDDDDVCLITLIVQYSFNWSLICDAFNSIRRPITGEQRTPYECHERWRQNNLTSLSGQINAAYAIKMKRDNAKRVSIVKLDGPKKRQRQYNIFEAIKKTQVKREQAQKPNSSAPPPRSTIETHGVGLNGQRLATPMELSMAKAQRDRSLAQALLESRQLSAAYGLAAQRTHTIQRASHPGAIPMPHPQLPGQPRPPAATQVARPMAPTSPGSQRPAAPVTNIPNANNMQQINQFPPNAQLQLMRQRQMLLAAAAAARPPASAPLQQFPNNAQQQSSPVQQAQVQAQTQSPQIGMQSAAATNTLSVAAQLAQMGYPLPQLGQAQQAQLQRYLQQMQLRNQATQAAAAAVAAAAANPQQAGQMMANGVGQNIASPQQGAVPNTNVNTTAAALIAAQQARLQQVQAAQQQQHVARLQQQAQQQAAAAAAAAQQQQQQHQ